MRQYKHCRLFSFYKEKDVDIQSPCYLCLKALMMMRFTAAPVQALSSLNINLGQYLMFCPLKSKRKL